LRWVRKEKRLANFGPKRAGQVIGMPDEEKKLELILINWREKRED